MEIKLSTCVLRPMREEDIPSLAANANNKKISDNLRDRFPHPYTEGDALHWFKLPGSYPPTRFVIAVDGLAVGGVGLIQQEDVYRVNAELGYWLGEKYWGRGIATDAVAGMAEYAFQAFPILERLFADVYEHNKASMRVLEKAGFTLEAVRQRAAIKNGRVINTHFYFLNR